jgi:Domain of unknown function (DUF4129)
VRDAPEGLLAGRALALYALSLGAAASATLAWSPDPSGTTLRLVTLAAGLAGALVFGNGLCGWLLAVLERRTLSRLRLGAAAVYLGFVFMALLVALGAALPGTLATETSIFAALQLAVVLLADVLGGHVAAVTNALVLTVLASLGGGTVAAVAVTTYLGLLVYFLTFDHFVRRLFAYPQTSAALLGAAGSQATVIAAPLVLGMAAFFAAVSPSPYTRLTLDLRSAASAPRELDHAFARLVLLALLGSGVVFGLRRALGSAPVREPPTDEVVEPERGPEEALEVARTRRKTAYPGRRGRIVRTYVRFLAEAERRGLHRRPSQTPLTIAAQIREPAVALGRLTELFMGSRYGSDDPDEEQVRAAEAASRTILDSRARTRR